MQTFYDNQQLFNIVENQLISMVKKTICKYIEDPVLRRSVEQIKKQELLKYIAQFTKICKIRIEGQFYDSQMNLTEFCFENRPKDTSYSEGIVKQKTKKIKKNTQHSKNSGIKQQKLIPISHINTQNKANIPISQQMINQKVENSNISKKQNQQTPQDRLKNNQ